MIIEQIWRVWNQIVKMQSDLGKLIISSKEIRCTQPGKNKIQMKKAQNWISGLKTACPLNSVPLRQQKKKKYWL